LILALINGCSASNKELEEAKALIRKAPIFIAGEAMQGNARLDKKLADLVVEAVEKYDDSNAERLRMARAEMLHVSQGMIGCLLC
jgi:hypothetical protein